MKSIGLFGKLLGIGALFLQCNGSDRSNVDRVGFTTNLVDVSIYSDACKEIVYKEKLVDNRNLIVSNKELANLIAKHLAPASGFIQEKPSLEYMYYVEQIVDIIATMITISNIYNNSEYMIIRNIGILILIANATNPKNILEMREDILNRIALRIKTQQSA